MLYEFDKRYGTCKFVWYSVVHTPLHLYKALAPYWSWGVYYMAEKPRSQCITNTYL